jgi:hypothetical protein
MNAEQMRSALVAFADFARAGQRASALNALASLFEGVGSAKVAKIVATIEGNWKSANRVPRHPAELRAALAELHRALDGSGAKMQAKAFAGLLRLFRGTSDQPVDAFLNDAVECRGKKKPARQTALSTTPITREQARRLADQLTCAADDRKKFDTLLEQMKTQFKVDDLRTIAGLYTGYETSKTKKDDIIRAIRHWHREDEMNRDRRASQAKTGL